jgi:hypothetical protein
MYYFDLNDPSAAINVSVCCLCLLPTEATLRIEFRPRIDSIRKSVRMAQCHL